MNSQNPDQVINDVMQMEERNRQALSLLLELQREKDGHLLALRTRMGEITSFVASVTLSWVAQNVYLAGNLPIFKRKADTTKKLSKDEDMLDDIKLLQPDWRRQLPMALYLATRRHHKFPPLLVVGCQDWVYDKDAEQWGLDRRAMQNSHTAISLEPEANYCDLDTKNTKYYALDGQHRLMAILGVHELLTKGKLFSLDANGKPDPNRFITRETIYAQAQKEKGEDEYTVHNRLEGLMSERIGIEIIPAVVSGETYKEAIFRLRDTFLDVNENTRSLSNSEFVQLN